MADELPPLIAQLLGDASDLFGVLDDAEARLTAFANQTFEASLALNVDEAMADLTAFLSVADSQSVTIPVSLDTSAVLAQMAAIKAAGGGGGGLAAAAAAGAAGGGGGGGGGLLAALGFGGAASRGIFGFGAGLAGFGTLGSLAGLGPESLLTTLLGVGGSALGGLAGGGALALGSLSVAGVGLGTDLAGIGQAAGDIKGTVSAMNNLNQAIAVYGKGSIQATTAQAQLNAELNSFSPLARAAVTQAANTAIQFKTLFDAATGAAESTGAQIINQVMVVAEKFLPTIGKFAAENMLIIQKSLQPLFTWIQGPGLQIFTKLEQIFQNSLPTAMHAFTQGVELIIKTLGFLAPYTGRFITFLDDLFTKLNGPDFGKWTHDLADAIGIFRDWEGLIKAVGTAIYELFTHDASTGTDVILELTTMINKFNEWVKTTSGGDSLHSLLVSHRNEILAIIELLGHLLSSWGQLELTVRPFLQDVVGDLAKFLNLLFQIPGVGKILGLVAAFEILGRHISIIGSIVGAFNNSIKRLIADGLVSLGGFLTSLGGPFETLGTTLTGFGTKMQTSMVTASDSLKVAADSMAVSADRIAVALDSIGVAADGAAAQVVTATSTMDAALATEGGVAAGAAAEGGGGLLAGIGGRLGVGVAGLLAVALYNAFAEKKVANVIGKNAASALGDAGTGAAIGFVAAGPWGALAGAAMGAAFAERTGIENLFRGSNTRGAHPNTALAHARSIFAVNAPPPPTPAQLGLAKDSTLNKEIAAIQTLRYNVNAAAAKDGTNSAAYKAALNALNTTQEKYFPQLGKHEDLAGLQVKEQLLYGQILDLKASQHSDQLAGNDQLKGANNTLKQAKDQLKILEAGGATKGAVDLAKTAVDNATTHVDQVKNIIAAGNNVQQAIKTDTGKLSKLETMATILGKINSDTSKLHTDFAPMTGAGINIARLPPQAMKSSGNITLRIS